MKKTVIGILLVLCLGLTGCGKSGSSEKAQIGYKPPEIVDETIQTGEKLDLSDEDKEKVATATGDVVALEDYSAKFPVATKDNHFTVFDLNLCKEDGEGDRSYATRYKALMTLLLEANPDVITFQEVGSNWMDYLVPQLEGIYDFYLIYPQKADKTTANPIFFKKEKFTDETGGCFWLSDTPQEESASADGKYYNCMWLQLKEKTTGNAIYIFNSQIGKGIGKSGAEQIREKCELIGWREPIVCNVDLGAALESEAGELLLKNLRNSNTENDQTATSHQYTGKTDVHDFSLYTKVTLTPQSYKVLTDRPGGIMVSDHNPILAEYALNTENLNYDGAFIF